MPIIKIKPYSVPENDPFAGDIFKRQQLVESIANLAIRLEEPMVLGLSAPWGHGKSTIIERLRAHISTNFQSDIAFIHYDAYKNDYMSDVFISFVSSINNFLESNIEKASGDSKSVIVAAQKELIASGAKICKSLVKNGLIRGIKHASSGLIDIQAIGEDIETVIKNTISDSAKDIVESASAGVENLIKERFAEACKDIDLIQNFTQKLQLAIESTSKKRLIFVIDELDRCQPSFSVEVLEKIKHFFGSEKVLFVLAYNKEQLNQSIRHVYGVSNPNIYLQRFIDLESDVSTKIDTFEDEQAVSQYINWLFTQHSFDKEWTNPINKILKDSFKMLDQNYSLRSIERICTKIATYCLIRSEGGFIYDKHIIVMLCMLSVSEPKYYKAIQDRAIFVSNSPHGEDPTIDIENTEENLKNILTLVKDNNESFFGFMYNYIIHHLFIKDGENTGEAFHQQTGFVDRNQYIRGCCDLISGLIIAEQPS